MFDTEALRAWIAERGGGVHGNVDDATPLFSSGMFDSFDMIELVVFVERQTGRRVRPMDVNLGNFDSIEKILTFVAK